MGSLLDFLRQQLSTPVNVIDQGFENGVAVFRLATTAEATLITKLNGIKWGAAKLAITFASNSDKKSAQQRQAVEKFVNDYLRSRYKDFFLDLSGISALGKNNNNNLCFEF